jgi:predicted signal transduction protein with EAL and GGDEF domain
VAIVDIDNLGEVVSFMDRLAEALRLPIRIADKEFMCTLSAGIALAPNDGDTAPELLRHADIALARAKAEGGQRLRFFEESMDKALQRRHTVAQDLRLALRREEFEVVYQSQFDLATGEQTGVEALVRWHHPVHGKVAPTLSRWRRKPA